MRVVLVFVMTGDPSPASELGLREGGSKLVGDYRMERVIRIDRLPSRNVRAIFLTVSLGLATILLAIWLITWWVSPTTLAWPITGVILLALVPNVAVATWRGDAPDAVLAISLLMDSAALTAAIHYGGGVDQVSGPLLYSIVIALAGLILSEWAAFVAAGVS